MLRRTPSVHVAIAAAALAGATVVSWAGPSVEPPAPLAPVPSARQLAWHDLQFYGFIHFGINTFTDREWGYGDESEEVFNPTALDAQQWVRVAREAGMTGLILTAKHHDGFALWPSRFTGHSVQRSPWKEGRGDVVAELATACREAGLKFGVYLSPWDRNRADYGRPSYLEYYRNQLQELLSGYGPLFEVWFDGANGGDGYYGGARERRQVDAASYYDWPATWQLVRDRQPAAVIFSDAGPDVRWVGNERGVAFETSWYPLTRRGLYPGKPDYESVAAGSPDGTDWVPPEADVSIRPGWFYHAAEDGRVASVERLVEMYEQSVGRGANLLLNMPPDRRGLIPDVDAERLRALGRTIARTYETDLARGAVASATSVRGGMDRFGAARVNDGDPQSYWALDDGVTTGAVELSWPKPVHFDRVVLRETIALGQRITAWTIEADVDGRWVPLSSGTTVGARRIARVPPTTTARLRVRIDGARACPTLSTIGVYLAPEAR